MCTSKIFSITAGTLFTVLGCGCNSTMFNEEKKVPEKPVYDAQKHIEQLQTEVTANKKISMDNKAKIDHAMGMLVKLKTAKAKSPGSPQDKMVEAAVLLAKNSTNSQVKYNAIRILGYLRGPKAEAALIAMLDTCSQQYKREVLQALSNMNSSKLYGIVIKMLETANAYDTDALCSILNSNNFRGLITKKDIPLLLAFYQKMPKNNNNRYRRRDFLRMLARLDALKAADLVCQELVLTTQGHYKREMLYAFTNHDVEVPYEAWKKVFSCLGPATSSNYDAYRNIFDRFRNSSDWRLTDLILPMVEYATANKSFGNSLIYAMSNMRDPKAAPALVKLLNMKEFKHQNVSDFPGIVKKNNEYLLADKAEMEKLMALRKRRMEQLAKFEKMRQNIK